MRTRLAALLLGTAVVVGLSLAPRDASAQEHANGLGEKHQLIISVDRLVPILSYTSQTVSSTGGGQTLEDNRTGTSAGFLLGQEPSLGAVHTIPRVAFDFTIIQRLTLGGAVAFAFGLGGRRETQLGNNNTRRIDTPTRTIFGFAPRVGYVLPFAHNFAFWPRVGFAFYSVSGKEKGDNAGATVTTTTTDTVWSIDVDPQLVWTPIPHFFFHAGPVMNIPLTGSNSVETDQGASSNTQSNDLSVFHLGLSAGLGGWFDL